MTAAQKFVAFLVRLSPLAIIALDWFVLTHLHLFLHRYAPGFVKSNEIAGYLLLASTIVGVAGGVYLAIQSGRRIWYLWSAATAVIVLASIVAAILVVPPV